MTIVKTAYNKYPFLTAIGGLAVVSFIIYAIYKVSKGEPVFGSSSTSKKAINTIVIKQLTGSEAEVLNAKICSLRNQKTQEESNTPVDATKITSLQDQINMAVSELNAGGWDSVAPCMLVKK